MMTYEFSEEDIGNSLRSKITFPVVSGSLVACLKLSSAVLGGVRFTCTVLV